uniref:E2F/DP family winged-helix DNA-binding domain-containing protein n=1 Tax=Wuchereria bancrofti TaxID=6293 RepID=A0A1I8ENU1_WUCBA
MHQHPSISGSCQLSTNNSTEGGISDRSQREARSAVLSNDSKEESTQLYDGLRMPKSSVHGTKSVSVFQDPSSTQSQRLSFDENLPTLTAVNLNVSSHMEDIRKRKALKMRNITVGNQQCMNVIKSERNGNHLNDRIGERQNRNKSKFEWNLKNQRNGCKNSDGNNGKWKEKFGINQKNYGIRNGNEREIKLNRNAHCCQRDYEGSSGNVNEIKWNRNMLIDQNDYEKSSGNRCKIKCKRNIAKSLKRNGNEIEIITGRSDNDELGGNRAIYNGNTRKGQNVHEESGRSRIRTKQNGNTCSNQGDIEERNRNGDEIKRNGNSLIDQNDGDELNENEGECNESDRINQNEIEETVGNGTQQNSGNGEEANSGFPRKTKTLGLLCRKFFLKVLEYVESGDNKINLETIACSMEVEKRRIYDVVNVMEALGAMEKSHKSFYTWKGLDNLPSTLHTLKIEANKEGIYEKVLMTQHIMTRFMEIPNRNGNISASSVSNAGPSHASDDNSFAIEEQSNSLGNNDSANDYQPDYKVSLDVASTILIKDPEIDGCKPPDRSRCRRIYDVANVLISLRLIERRMFTFGTKKIPLFVYCGPKIIENGKFDFFHHIRFNKLSIKLKNSEEKKAYEVEEGNLEIFFLKRRQKKAKIESSDDVIEPAEKRSKIEGTDSIQENIDLNKENVPTVLINQVIPSSDPTTSMPIIRPQPQKITDLTSFPASQTFSPSNDLQSFVKQSALNHFSPMGIRSQQFLSFNPTMILSSNGDMLHNVNSSQIPMQQNHFNYLSIAYPFSSMAFFQQPCGPTINATTASYTAYNNNPTNNPFFTNSRNTLRSSMFNIDSILGNRETHTGNQDNEMKHPTSISQPTINQTDQNSLLHQCSDILFNYSSIFDPNKKQYD